MELVPATSSGGNTDSTSIQIDPVARRVANIQTVAVKSMPMTRKIRAIGELSYDEGTLKSISAYVDGRLDRLYADYTGVFVKKAFRVDGSTDLQRRLGGTLEGVGGRSRASKKHPLANTGTVNPDIVMGKP